MIEESIRGDEPPPGNDTNRALDTIKKLSKDVKIITYDASPAGTHYVKGTTNPIVAVPPEGYIRLRKPKEDDPFFLHISYHALIAARALENGIFDTVISRGQMSLKLRVAFANLSPNIPKRGTVMSSGETSYLTRPPSGIGDKVTLEAWYKSNKKSVDDFYANINEALKLLWANKLLGWGDIADIGEELHDCLPPEFGWEFLG